MVHSIAMTSVSASDLLIRAVCWQPNPLLLCFDQLELAIRANSSDVLAGLERYFHAFVVNSVEDPVPIDLVDTPALDLDIDFVDWTREPGKTGRKDTYVDLVDGRLLRKARTGMVFLQSRGQRVAAGPCLENLNQVINFINSQLMNQLQQQNWLICHASAVASPSRCIAFAGFSGGGKSTTMLHTLSACTNLDYVTNDRLFIKLKGQQTLAKGIPKQPRVNPGTILNNDKLIPMLSQAQSDSYLALAKDDLWQLEDKYDVDVAAMFGSSQNLSAIPITDLIVLNWHRNDTCDTKLTRIDLRQRQDLLPAVMKSPGPFYLDAQGHMQKDGSELDRSAYLDALQTVNVIEVTGMVGFEKVVEYCLGRLQ